MSSEDEAEFLRLRALAAEAARGRADGGHASDDDLARIRRGDDDPSLSDVFRHIAGCASCRARLAASEGERRHAAELVARATTKPAARVIALPPPARRVWPWLAAAAVILLVIGAATLFRRTNEEPLALSQKRVATMMGPSDAGQAPPGEAANIEITLSTRAESAALFVIDARGKRLSRTQWMIRTESSLAGVVAPRAFGAHEEPASALVVAGEKMAVTNVLAELEAELVSGKAVTSAALEERAKMLARGKNARAARLELGPGPQRPTR